jgi:hypothetical protein
LNSIGILDDLYTGYPQEAFVKKIGGINGFFQGDPVTHAATAAEGSENEYKNDREHQTEKNRGRIGKDGFETGLGDGQ